MNERKTEEEILMEKFEEDIVYLQETIPPDDIYIFAQHALLGSLHFIEILKKQNDLQHLAENDEETNMHLTNVLQFLACQNERIPIQLSLNFRSRRKK